MLNPLFNFGGMLSWKSGLRFYIRVLEVPFSIQRPLLHANIASKMADSKTICCFSLNILKFSNVSRPTFTFLRFTLLIDLKSWKVGRDNPHTKHCKRLHWHQIAFFFSSRHHITCLEGIKSLFLSKFYCVERKQLCTACTHINPCFWTHGGFFWAKNVVVFSNSLNYSQVQKNC